MQFEPRVIPSTSAHGGGFSSVERRTEQQAFVAQLGQIALAGAELRFLFDRACDGVRRLLDMDRSSIYEASYDRSALLWRYGAGWDDRAISFVRSIPLDGVTPPAVAYETGTAVVLGHYPSSRFAGGIVEQIGAVSGVSVPIGISSWNRFGILSTHSLTPRPVSDDDSAFVTSVANVLAAAIDHHERQAELANRAQRQHMVAQLGRDLLRADDSEFLHNACVAVARALETDLVVVLSADHQRSTITAEAHYGYPDWLRGRTFAIAESGCANWTLSHAGAHVIHDVETETRFRPHPISAAEGARSGICVAIPDADQSWGVIVTYSRTRRTFGENDVDFLTSVAHLLSAAIYRRRTEEKLEQQRQDLQELADNAPDIIGRFAPDGTVLFMNEALKRIGRDPVDVLGTSSVDVMGPEMAEPWSRTFQRVVETGTRQFVEIDAVNGHRMEVRFAPEFEGDRVVSVLAIARDITERRRAEEECRKLEMQLEQAKRVASIGRLGTTVAHEFNNVLMSISPFAELIARACSEQPQIARAAQHIHSAVVRGRRVTQEIMRFTRPAEPATENVDLVAWLPGIVQSLRPALGELDLRVNVPATNLHANVDRQQIEQVLTNLLLNARDALSGKCDARIDVSLRRNGPSVRLAVCDNGCGIPQTVVPNIFEPFFTTKRSGTGLGLAVVRQIVESHGGSIDLVTHEGAGTTFNVMLPLVSAGGEKRELQTRRVLVVEDNDVVAAGIIGLLELYGADVAHAPTGADALAAVGEMAPDAIVLDVTLPDIDGVELFHRIRRSKPEVPVIFSTGHADHKRLQDLLADRTVTHLMKPYDLEELTAALTAVLPRSA